MPTNIVKSEFPPLEQWEEMEIVEDIGTADEHADPFYRWNNYGIEVHEDGLCQAYVIIQTDEGEIPKMVSEGFSSPEAVIEFFKNTEGEKELTEGEGNAPEMEGEEPEAEVTVAVAEGEPEEKAEAEKEPEPEKKEESEDDKKPVKKSDVAKVGESTDPMAKPPEDGANGDVKNKDPAGTDVPHATIGQNEGKEEKIPGEKENPFACSETEEPEPLGDYPVIKSYAEMRAEWEATHREYNPPATYVPGRTQKTLQKTQCKEYSDKCREYPVDEIDKDPTQRKEYKSTVTHPNPHPIGSVRKSVEFGSIPTWEDMKAGYDFVEPTSPIAKTMIPSTDEQIPGRAGDNIDSNNPEDVPEDVPEAPAEIPEAPAEIPEDVAPEEPIEQMAQKIAEAVGKSPEEVLEMAQTEEGVAELEALLAAAQGGEGAPAEEPAAEGEPVVDSDTADDGQKRITLQSEPEDTL